jgi:hypothetical protein
MSARSRLRPEKVSIASSGDVMGVPKRPSSCPTASAHNDRASACVGRFAIFARGNSVAAANDAQFSNAGGDDDNANALIWPMVAGRPRARGSPGAFAASVIFVDLQVLSQRGFDEGAHSMLRFLSAIVAMTMLTMLSADFAAAGGFGGCDGCFPGDLPPYWVPRVHKFRPVARDGVPVVTNRRLYPEGYHGVGCIWSRRVVETPRGRTRILVPDCVSY